MEPLEEKNDASPSLYPNRIGGISNLVNTVSTIYLVSGNLTCLIWIDRQSSLCGSTI